jgi:hypothetical protein
MKIGSGRAFARAVALLIAVLATGRVEAYVEDIRVLPAYPVAGRPVTLAAHAGECHGFTSGGQRRLERNGNQLRVYAEGAISISPACIGHDHQFRFDMGPLEAGTYEVTLVLEDLYFMEETIAFDAVQFTVGSPSRIPARSNVSPTLLAILIAALAFAAVALRSRTRSEKTISRAMAGLLSMLVPALASAHVGPPRIDPAHPKPNQLISVVVTTGGCHTFLEAIDGLRTVERVGNRIDVTIEGFEGLGGACLFFPDHVNVFPIGPLPAGSYELHFHFFEREADPEIFETGSVIFTVAEPHSIPRPWLSLHTLTRVKRARSHSMCC